MNAKFKCVKNTNIHSHSIIKLENGYGVSIIKLSNCTECKPYYEVAIIKFNSQKDYIIVYPTFTNGDIIKCDSYQQVEELILLTRRLELS